MNLYLDTEFNGHGGELISMALVCPFPRAEWYEVLHLPERLNPWVAEHVVPVLGKATEGRTYFNASLHSFLSERPGANVYADWPADFEHFLRALVGRSFAESLDYQCTMHLIKTPPGEPKPEVPHNALSDAIALMKWHAA